MNIRTGFGVDTHQLKEGFELIIGGLTIPHNKGSVGHSDADVLIHSICDALLGAANLGDIGTHFPDTDMEFKNIDSKILLSEVMKKIRKNGYEVSNLDSTICLQNPKINKYIKEMKLVLSKCMNIESDLISIKATTGEKIGFIGREEGVTAYCSVLLYKSIIK